MDEFGLTSPGYNGLGKSKEEVIDIQDDLAVLEEFFGDILGSISDVFQYLSLVVAK